MVSGDQGGLWVFSGLAFTVEELRIAQAAFFVNTVDGQNPALPIIRNIP